MAAANTTPRPVLKPGAVYWADNGCRICARCAGASALYTGHDLSGQKVERVNAADVRNWPGDLGALRCERGCTTLSRIVDADGWPLATVLDREPACPCGCDGQIDRHDDRGWGPWACPVCDEDSDRDLGRPCGACETKGGTDA